MEKLLLIHSTKKIQLQVKNVASRLKLALDIIPEEYCGCCLKELAAGKYAQNPPSAAGIPDAETLPSCLVLCGLREKRLDKVLFELRREDIPIDFKAILTPSNQEWTVPELMKELQRERQAVGR